MKIKLGSMLLAFLISLVMQSDENGYRQIKNTSFNAGERLEYRVHLGFLSGAYATIDISETIYSINGRPCFKVNIFGRTAGVIDLFYKVRDTWGSYLDTAAIVPQRFYRYIRENKYRKNEIVDFNHLNDSATVARLDKKTMKLKEKVIFPIANNTQDLVSGAFFLRTMDLDKKRNGDIIRIKGFFDDETFNMKIKYLGTEKLKTKVGTFETHVMAPILPENKLFKGQDAIRLWLSKDENKIPLKIQADMFVGAIEIDIKSYENLRNKIG